MVRAQRTSVRGRVMHYLESGLGQPIVFLHAFPLDAEMWRAQLERVPRGWRMIAPDFRGFGGSTLNGEALRVANYAEDVVDLLDALDIEKAVVCGLSMGGYVAFAIFRLAPTRLSGLVLADTRSTEDSYEGLRTRRELLANVRKQGVRPLADGWSKKLVGETTQRERPDVLTDVRRRIESAPVRGIEAASVALMTRPDSTPDLPRIECPSLIVVGEEDTITPVADSEALHRGIRGSRLALLARAGHLSNLEAPEEFSTTISEWVVSLG
ncbi:MAG TPA: alpha/beta fold hydrolase [Vicinamibacterales bacterium]